MSTHNDLSYGTGDVERYAGVTQAVARDWRRRGMLASLGKEQNGRWRYSSDDLVSFAVISQLTKTSTIDLLSAWELSGLISNVVIERIRGEQNAEGAWGGRYFFMWPRDSIGEDVALGAVDDNLDRAMAHSPGPVAICIDLDKLIDALPHALVNIVRDTPLSQAPSE